MLNVRNKASQSFPHCQAQSQVGWEWIMVVQTVMWGDLLCMWKTQTQGGLECVWIAVCGPAHKSLSCHSSPLDGSNLFLSNLPYWLMIQTSRMWDVSFYFFVSVYFCIFVFLYFCIFVFLHFCICFLSLPSWQDPGVAYTGRKAPPHLKAGGDSPLCAKCGDRARNASGISKQSKGIKSPFSKTQLKNCVFWSLRNFPTES